MVHLWYITVLSLLMEYQVSTFPTESANPKNFYVNVAFQKRSDCCASKSSCKFHSLHHALSCIMNSTTIFISSSKVILNKQVSPHGYKNVMIVGSPYATITCEDKSFIRFEMSYNITIKNLTWENCGFTNNLWGQLNFYSCSGVYITNSMFQNSSSVGAALIGVYGNVTVQGSTFQFNAGNGQAGGMLVSTDTEETGNINAYLHLVIYASSFSSNNAICFSDQKCSGGLYLYIPNGSVNTAQLDVKKSNFTSHGITEGAGAIFIVANIIGKLTISISEVTFSNNFGQLSGALYLETSSYVNISIISTNFTHNGAVVLHGVTSRCMQMSITNVNFCDNSPGDSSFDSSIIILEFEGNYSSFLNVSNSSFQRNYMSVFTISTCQTVIASFSKVKVSSNIGKGGITLKYNPLCQRGFKPHRIEFTDSNFTSNALHSGVISIGVVADSIIIANCSFNSNSPHDGVVVICNTFYTTVTVQGSNFSNNYASGLYVSHGKVRLLGHIEFNNNTASNGGGITLMEKSSITLTNAYLTFIGNFAVHYGGAIYAKVTHCDDVVIMNKSNSSILFVDNSASFAGNSSYFNILSSCVPTSNCISSLRNLHCDFNVSTNISSENNFSCHKYLNSSPMKFNTSIPNCNNSIGCYFNIGTMLGEEFTLPLKVIDYFNHTAEPTVFLVDIKTTSYKLGGSPFTIISNDFEGIAILGTNPGQSKLVNITIELSTVEVANIKNITLQFNISLEGCHAGFVYSENESKCICFAKHAIMQCVDNVSMITRGYWFGYVNDQPTMSTCPINYCKYAKCNSDKSNLCTLYSDLQEQCQGHRTGIACSKCKSSYTLSFDSTVCVSNNQCTTVHTALVVILIIIYWIVIVAVVFIILSFRLKINYLFAIIYFYSIVDLVLGNNVYISDGVFQTVTLLSSFAKISPQFLGKLCLAKGMSGIDQLFIHYIHPLAILIILVLITVVARNSLWVSNLISPIIIRVICLLLLLSYTSMACTSLSLLRHLEFTGSNTSHATYTYLSPDIKFFHGRHALYGGVAVLCELIIGIGLPLLLILDPYISHRINLIKIRPLLDQFQGGYKDQYRWCSSYYLICRQIIFLVVYLTTLSNYEQMNFVLLVVCAAVAMFHAWIQPYAKESLNSLDEVILVSLVVIVGLNRAAFSSETLAKMIMGFIFFPLFCFVGFLLLHPRMKGRIMLAFSYAKHALCCGTIQQRSIRNIQDNGALDDYNQYDRSVDSENENQPLLPNSTSGSVLRYRINI